VKKTVPASVFSWYGQLGSYSTRALAEAGQRKLAASHASLFSGQKFVILAAQLKNGTTTYRLRVGFNSSADANSFCRNAKADGLECYVTK
jgi:cell division protein FtsN